MTENRPGALDEAHIAKLRALGGDAFVKNLWKMFVEQTTRRIAELREAMTAGDRDGVVRAAHSIKSSAGNIGAGRLRELAERVELGGGEDGGAVGEMEEEWEGVGDASAAERGLSVMTNADEDPSRPTAS